MVRLGSGARPQVVQGLEHAEAGPGHQRAAVVAHAADRFGDPGGIAGEQLVVLGGAQEAHDAELDDEVVDDLLGLALGEAARLEVALEVDVEEGGDAAQRHGGAVLLFHRRQISEVEPLHGLAGGAGRGRDVEAVAGGHGLELLQGPPLLGELLAVADDLFRRGLGIEGLLLLLLPLDQAVDAVQRHPAVVADDAAAAIGVRQAGEHVRAAAAPDVLGIGVEHGLVVGLAILGERLHDVGIGGVAVCLQRAEHHAQAAVGHDRPLERRLGLQADDDLVLLVDVAGRVGGDRAGSLRDVEDALPPLLHEEVGQNAPDPRRPGGDGRQERPVAVVGRVVHLDEGADVDLPLPEQPLESFPGRFGGSRYDLFRRQ